MGSSVSKVNVDFDAPSLTNPELLAVVSQDIQEYATYDRLFDELILLCKEPPLSSILKDCKLVETSENTFEVTKILVLKDGGEQPPLVEKYSVDKEKGIVNSTVFSLDGAEMWKNFTLIQREPTLRIQFYSEGKQGERAHGKMTARIIQGFLDTVLARIAEINSTSSETTRSSAGVSVDEPAASFEPQSPNGVP